MKSKLAKVLAVFIAVLVFAGGVTTGNAIAETLHQFRNSANVEKGTLSDDTGNPRFISIELNATDLVTGEIPDARLSTNVTVEGNTFNGNDQLVQLDGSGDLPALDGSALTGVTSATADALTSDPANCADSSLAIGIEADGTATCALVSDVDGGVNGSTSPSTANALFDHEADASRHHTATVSGDITHDSTIGGTTDDAHFDHADDLTELNSQIGSGLVTGAHTTTLAAEAITAGTFPDGAFDFGTSSVTIAGTTFQAGKLTADICTSLCSSHNGTTQGCMVRSGDDFSWYSSTGSAIGMYRNERSGTGPC